VFYRVAATPVLCFGNTDATAFAAIQTTGEEFEFLAGTESLEVLFLLHGWTDVRRVSDGHFDGFCFELGNFATHVCQILPLVDLLAL
jgi:hypothetical protein